MINITDALEEHGKCAKVQTATRRFIKNFRNPADLSVIAAILTEEYSQCREDGDFSGAKIFVDLAIAADKSNQQLQQASFQMQFAAAMLLEVDRMIENDQLFPLVLMDAIGWIAEEFQVMTDELEEMTEAVPEEFLNEMRGMPEEYAAGIIRLKKKCPSIYRYYQQRWDQLFQEKTAGLNREARRSLRL